MEMKLTPLLGALLLSSTPAFANDFIYLQCDANIQLRTRDKTSLKLPREESEDFVINFRIDIKKKVMVESKDGVERPFEILRKGLLLQKIRQQDPINLVELDTYIQYDPPGRMHLKSYSSVGTEEGTGKGEGKCKASNASEYEASK